jgi:hypothetical protein
MSDEQDALQSIPDAAEPVPSPAPSEAPPGGTEKITLDQRKRRSRLYGPFRESCSPEAVSDG